MNLLWSRSPLGPQSTRTVRKVTLLWIDSHSPNTGFDLCCNLIGTLKLDSDLSKYVVSIQQPNVCYFNYLYANTEYWFIIFITMTIFGAKELYTFPQFYFMKCPKLLFLWLLTFLQVLVLFSSSNITKVFILSNKQ